LHCDLFARTSDGCIERGRSVLRTRRNLERVRVHRCRRPRSSHSFEHRTFGEERDEVQRLDSECGVERAERGAQIANHAQRGGLLQLHVDRAWVITLRLGQQRERIVRLAALQQIERRTDALLNRIVRAHVAAPRVVNAPVASRCAA
jgi:hypothetical protein